MLAQNIINAKSVAFAATEAASNKIPYLGLGFFPEQKKAGIDLRWIKAHKGVTPILAASNFDALPVIKSREGIKIETTEMPFFRESKQITERDLIEIGRAEDANDEYLLAAVRSVYDDTNNLIASAEVVGEVMRMQLLAAPNGSPSIGIESEGVSYVYNYDADGSYAANNYTALSGTSVWTAPTTATPIDDLQDAITALANNGVAARYVLMNSATFALLRNSDQVKSLALTTNAAGTIFMTDTIVRTILKDTLGIDVLVYDKTYVDADGNTVKYYPDGQVTLLPEGALGTTWYGTTPAERSVGQVTNADTTIYGTGIAITTEPEIKSGVYKFVTTASEIVLPSYENMDSTYVIKVAANASV